MPHTGRTVDQLNRDGVTSAEALQHALSDPALIVAHETEGHAVQGDGRSILDLLNGVEDEDDDGSPTSTSTSVSEIVDVGERTDVTRSGSFRSDEDRIIRDSVSRFVNVPTAEEVLDDFDVAFSGFVADARVAGLGDIDSAELGELRSDFFNDFLGDLAQRAARGEDLFDVVGLESDPTFLGERQGEQAESESVSVTRESGADQVDIDSRVTTESTATGTSTATAGDESESGSTTETRDRVTTVDERTRTESDTIQRDDVSVSRDTTERVFERPNLTTVRSTSPGEFLRGALGVDPGAIATAVKGRRGRRQGLRRAAGGGIAAGAQRI